MGSPYMISNPEVLCKSLTSKNSSCVNPEFSVRIVVCDHYLTKPVPEIDPIYSEFRGSTIKQVPVLRIFGSTPEGRKACLHVHGVFPYFYIPCPTTHPEPQFLYQIAASLDRALNIAFKQATSANQHVYKISLVKGLPFYGFHDKEHLYLKIFLYNPGLVKQAVDLCSNGAILGQSFQPHESHLNFTLQFFIDFNLFGMSNIDLQKVKFRKSGFSLISTAHQESPEESSLKPESGCFYEADCAASHIINRQRVGKGDGIENPGLEEVWHQELERRKQLNVSLGSKSLSQGRFNSDETESHYKFEKMFMMRLSDLINTPVNTDNVDLKISEKIHYPAETKHDSQLCNATDVSTHLPESTFMNTLRYSTDNLTLDSMDDTLVSEDIALNSSICLHYSQVPLDSDDLELVDMLQDLDERPEEDSIMATPANAEDEANIDLDHVEYSQTFNEHIGDDGHSKGFELSTDTLSWDESFWDGVSIPQLDGTYDDECVKKSKKRKMTSFKLGLAKPKNKKKNYDKDKEIVSDTIIERGIVDGNLNNEAIKLNARECKAMKSLVVLKEEVEEIKMTNIKEEINKSNDIIDTSISDSKYNEFFIKNEHIEDKSTTDNKSLNILVDEMSKRHDLHVGPAASYDLRNQYKPKAGPSKKNLTEDKTAPLYTLSDSFESSPENENLGIESFYNASNLFNCSIEEDLKINVESLNEKNFDTQSALTVESKEDINHTFTYVKNNPVTMQLVLNKKNINKNSVSGSVILTPKIRPPSKSFIITTLDNYSIPHSKNPNPYYSDYKDVGDKVEIGQIILKLNSQIARDQKPFEKVLDTISIDEWRQLLFLQNNEVLEQATKPGDLMQLLASNKVYVLQPVLRAPTTLDVLKYLKEKHGANSECTDKGHACNEKTSKTLDELDNSQALGLNEDEISSSLSLSSSIKDKNDVDSSLQVTMQPDGSFLCFGSSENYKERTVDEPIVEMDFLTLMLIEVHTSVRGDLYPDPSIDQIQAIFVTVTNDCPPNHFLTRNSTQVLVVDDTSTPKLLERCTFNANVTYVSSETGILEELIKLVQAHDPDIMCGYEIEMNSWGYVLERAQILGIEIVQEFSRITEKHRQKRWKTDENEFEGKIIGRITFNVWRLFRHELALSSYSFESCMYEILKERVPKYSYRQLGEWWSNESRMLRWITVEYYLTRLSGTVRMLEKLDIINRTSELARLFGLQWWEVLSRGSQFRVESLMLRAARPLNLVALSPTVKQRAAMRAPECLPLIFEPESRYYTDPVIVLDFQSLYPSMMIAYNYCFSTCIGRVQNIKGDSDYEFGAWRLRIPKAKLEALQRQGLVHWSPVGVGFVTAAARRGVLPALLRRILAARRAVKRGMKMQTDEAVRKAMHSRQLGLKLIANVTYGYTAANFSGRMPCVEVGDSVVAKGRETLERAIRLVRENTQWNAKVVYGDTDSMFVQVPGGTRAQAFALGQQIADAVTADNPAPVALKLEKVYQPCILQTKKRYVGFMYESADQETPVYEAKGIETVRRDGCPAGVQLLRESLCSLFSHGDVSLVKSAVRARLARLAGGAPLGLVFTREYRGPRGYRPAAAAPPNEIAKLRESLCSLFSHGDVSLVKSAVRARLARLAGGAPLGLVFTREYRGPRGYRPGAAAPPNEIANRAMSRDRRSGPRVGERVGWVVAAGAPGAPLVRLARPPRDFLRDASLAPHVAYYATRVLLPPLHRCLSLLGADVFKWWREMGWSREAQPERGHAAGAGIARYMQRGRCATCANRGARSVCATCAARPQAAAAALAARASREATHLLYCDQICKSCCGHGQVSACENVECPVVWRREAAARGLARVRDALGNLPPHFNQETFDF